MEGLTTRLPEAEPVQAVEAVAVMETGVELFTATVFTVKVAVFCPARMVTLVGVTVATLVLLLETVTVEPPVGALPFKVTVAVEAVPPITGLGLSVTEATAGGLTVMVADLEVAEVAVTVTDFVVATGLVETKNETLLEPAETVTEAGTDTPVPEEGNSVILTGVPPGGAVVCKVIVPID